MLSYLDIAQVVTDYLDEIAATDQARPFGTFEGGAVIQLSDTHYLGVLHPHSRIDQSEALRNCAGYLQDTFLQGWDIVSSVLLGAGNDTVTVLHIHPALRPMTAAA